MGTEARRAANGKMASPIEVIVIRHPKHKKQIQFGMKKWYSRTAGDKQWLREGTSRLPLLLQLILKPVYLYIKLLMVQHHLILLIPKSLKTP